MHYAAETGDLELVQCLVKNGADVHIRNNRVVGRGGTALAYAVRSGNLQLVKYLVDDLGLDVNIVSAYEVTPLKSSLKNPIIMKYLIEKGANVNYGANQTIFSAPASGADTILHSAAGSVIYMKQLKYLIEKGADINAQSYYEGFTPLHEAALNLNLVGFKYLVEKGADINIKSKKIGSDNFTYQEVVDRATGEVINRNKVSTPLEYLFDGNVHSHIHKYDEYYKEPINKLSLEQYKIILKLQGKIPNEPLTFDIHYKIFNEFLSKGCSWYSLSSYFVSECIRLKDDINNKISKSVNKIE